MPAGKKTIAGQSLNNTGRARYYSVIRGSRRPQLQANL
jgi:hypothetical protein